MLSPFLLAIFVSTVALGSLTGFVYTRSNRPLDGPPAPGDHAVTQQSWVDRFKQLPNHKVQAAMIALVAFGVVLLESRTRRV